MSGGPVVRALVVDDEPLICELVARALCDDGFCCEHAGDGDEAAERLAASKFDLLVTDLKMPNRHGYALIKDALRADVRPVIIVHTGVREPRLAADLLSRGVDDIIFKPVDVKLLAAKARTLVERKRARLVDRTMSPIVAAAPPPKVSSWTAAMDRHATYAEATGLTAP